MDMGLHPFRFSIKFSSWIITLLPERRGNSPGKYIIRLKSQSPLLTAPFFRCTILNTNIGYKEQEELINGLYRCKFPYTCPHGRPTIIKYPVYELEKLFKRVSTE